MGQIIDEDGSYISEPFFFHIGTDGVLNAFNYSMFGYNSDIDTGAYELIAAQGGAITILSAASTLTIVSDSTNDTSAGTGARTIAVVGIDANKELVTEVVTMNGTTNVVTTSTWLGVNRIAVLSAGASQYNEGNITVTATTGGSIQSYVPATDSLSQKLAYHVPSTHKAAITRVVLRASKATGGSLPKYTIKAFKLLNGVRYNLYEEIVDTNIKAALDATLINPVVIEPGAVWWFEAESDTNNGFIRGRVEQTLIKI